ncbi:MAG: hypothetical protein RLZZ15_4619 [Verrucomicrobiota bacterium]|jgi:hypothetical protein
MNTPAPTATLRRASALLAATALLATAGHLAAQTTFTPTSTFANFINGAIVPNAGLGGIASSGSAFAITGPTTGGITGQTFGQTFIASANGTATQAGDAAWAFQGNVGGSTLLTGSALAVSYNFTIGLSAGITSAVTWSLVFSAPGSGNNVTVATGTTSGSSTPFTGSGTYTFTTAATSSDTYRVYLDVGFTSNVAVAPGDVTVTMTNSGFGGGGITLTSGAAVPEPSTYAAMAGAAMLAYAIWRRRQSAALVAQA